MLSRSSEANAAPFAITRRAALTLASGGAAALLAKPAVLRGQGLRKVSFILPWIAQASTLYPMVAREKGFWSSRGLDVEISRGFGSVASTQAVATGRFDFGIVQAPSAVVSAAKGLPVVVLAIASYSAALGICVLADSPIRSPKDLIGKKIGGVPTAGDFLLFPAYLERANVDPKSLSITQLDNKILEQALIQKQLDAITAVVSSTAPAILSQGHDVRFLMFGDYGLDLYGLSLATNRNHVENDHELCEAVTDGLLEGARYALTNRDEALAVFYRFAPEVSLADSGPLFSEIGLAMFYHLISGAPARQQGLGAGDPAALENMIDIAIKYFAGADTKRPETSRVFDLSFSGRIKLTDQEWATVDTEARPYAKYFNTES